MIPKFVTFHERLEDFAFLGVEHVLTENSDFGKYWERFFELGGYDKIAPFAKDAQPLNIWYTNDTGTKIFFQGLMVKESTHVPTGFSLVAFPEGDYLVVTYEWVSADEFQMMEEIDAGWKYLEDLEIPKGYVRHEGAGITLMEKENTETPAGSRYEFWVPIKKG